MTDSKPQLPPGSYLILESLQQQEKRHHTHFLIAGTNKFLTLEVAHIAYFYSENQITVSKEKITGFKQWLNY